MHVFPSGDVLVAKRGIIQVKQEHGTIYQKFISLAVPAITHVLFLLLSGQCNAETANIPAADISTPKEAWVQKKKQFGYVQLVVIILRFYVLAT